MQNVITINNQRICERGADSGGAEGRGTRSKYIIAVTKLFL
jgi:hypothetical protein